MIFSSYKKHTTRIVLLVLLLAMVGIVWYGVMPLKQDVYEKMRGIQEFYARGENRDKQVARLPELKGQYDAIMENEGLINILISEDKVVDFVKTLEGLASETNIEMSITSKDNGKIVEPKKVATKSDPVATKSDQSDGGDSGGSSESSAAKKKVVDILNDIPFSRYLFLSIRARGQYEDIVAFLRKMETLPVGLDVIRVEMKEGDVQNMGNVVSGNDGVNPFSVSGRNVQTVVPESSVAKKRVFEAIFDVVVYVSKQN